MTVEFHLPDVGEGLHEAEVVQWLVEPGDVVVLNQPIVEILTDKSSVELPAPSAGLVTELGADVGDMVTVGELLIVIEDDATGTPAAVVAPEPEPVAVVPKPEVAPPDPAPVVDVPAAPVVTAVPTALAADMPVPAANSARPKASPSTRRLAANLGVDLRQVHGTGPGGRILEADVRGTSSGAAPPSRSPAPTAPAAPAAAGSSADLTAALAEIDNVLASPSNLPGSAEMVARALPTPTDWPTTTAADRTLAENPDDADAPAAVEAPALTAPIAPAPTVPAAPLVSRAPERRPIADDLGQLDPGVHPLRGVRRMTAKAMDLSWSTIPHITAIDEIDATALLETRAQLKSAAGDDGASITPLTLMMMAVAQALKKFPMMNASLDLEAETITVHDEVNVGVAVASSHGLIVPVVTGADERSILEMAREIARLSTEARSKKLANTDLTGGTFTVTNYGSHGGRYATPIIRPGEAGIIGFGGISMRPFVVNGEVHARPTLPVVLAGDHRLVDGDVLSAFHNFVCDSLTEPNSILYRAAL